LNRQHQGTCSVRSLVDGDRQSEVVWCRARNTRAHSDLLRQRAVSQREQAQALAIRLMRALSDSERRAHGDRGDTFSLRLARMPQVVALVRHELRRWLDERGLAPEDQVDITLACSEACANAVEHPGRPGRLAFEIEAWREGGELVLSVRDFGAWTDATSGENRGRGLSMIRSLMDAVEITSGGDGTRILMRRTLRPVS
jgi:anti-sigma regulatory factor (Ser/Thr protein kinase)